MTLSPLLRVTFDLMARGFAAELDGAPFDATAARRIERAVHHEERRGGVPLAFLAVSDLPPEPWGLWAIPEGQ